MYICLNRGTTGGGLSLEEFVTIAADAGFGGADVDMNWAEQHGANALADLYGKRNLRFGGWWPTFDHRTEPAKRPEGMKRLEVWAKIAQQLKMDSCATWIFPSSPLPFQETWKQHVDGLAPVARILADHGLRFGLEFVSPYHLRRQHPHEFIYTPGLMLELAAAVGPNVGLLVDCWHVYHSGTPWDQISHMPSQKIVMCHLNDSPDLPAERIEDGKRLLPGDGILDLPAFFRALKTAGYQGPVALEAFHCVKDLPPAEAAKRAWTATKKVLDRSGV